MRSTRHERRVMATRMLVVAGFLICIEAGPRIGWFDALTMVPFSRMLSQLLAFFRSGEIFPHLVATAGAVILAFVSAVLTGVPLGLLLWRWPKVHRFLTPYLTSYYAVPVFVFYPLLIVFFGFTSLPVVLIAWAWAVVAVIVNTAHGFHEVRPVYRKVARVFRLGSWRRFWLVELPAASPYVFNGIKLAVAYSIIGVVASEFVVSTHGLGWLVSYHYNNFGLPQMYASILLVLTLTVLINGLVARIQRLVGSGNG